MIAIGTFSTRPAIAFAVLWISLVGVALAWISGITLDLVRARERSVRARAVLHVLACAIGVLSIGYIAIMRDGLLDMLIETLKSGPGHG